MFNPIHPLSHSFGHLAVCSCRNGRSFMAVPHKSDMNAQLDFLREGKASKITFITKIGKCFNTIQTGLF